jgi:hypothetical protein
LGLNEYALDVSIESPRVCQPKEVVLKVTLTRLCFWTGADRLITPETVEAVPAT